MFAAGLSLAWLGGFEPAANSLRAQETPTPAAAAADSGAVLTTLDEFWTMPVAERNRPLAMRLECDVLFYDPAWKSLWVTDGKISTYATLGAQALPIRSGQRIRVSGVLPPPNLELSFEGATIEVVGAATLQPIAVAARIGEAALLQNQFVQIEAVVDRQSVMDPAHLRLVLSSEGREIVAWVLVDPDAPPPDLVGHSVRVRGVYDARLTPNGELSTLELNVPGVEAIEVLSRLADDPRFNIPVVSIGDLPRMSANTRVRVVGEAHAQSPGREVRMRDATGQVDLRSAQSLVLAPRELIEAIGYPVVRGTTLILEDAIFRRFEGDVKALSAPAAPATPEAPPGGLVVRRIQDFWDHEVARRTQPLQMDFECVVAYYDPGWRQLWIRDETAGAYVSVGDRPLPVRAGQRIRVFGTSLPPNTWLSLGGAALTVLGEERIPAVPLGDWSRRNPALTDRLVQTEGVVDRQTRSMSDSGHLRLFLVVDGRSIAAWVIVPPGDPVPDFTGAIVRVEGIYNPKVSEADELTGLELMVPGLDRVEVVGRLATDSRFDRPVVAIDELKQLPADRLVRVAGEVHSQQSGRSLRLRDGTGEVEVVTAQTLGLAVRERVEAVGRPVLDGIHLRLEGGVFRREDLTGTPPAPAAPVAPEPRTLQIAVDVLELSPEEAESRRPVEIEGVVTWAHPDYPYFYSQDSSGGVRVRRGPDPEEVAKAARSVRSTGVTMMGRFAPEVEAARISRIGVIALPEAPMISLEHALTGVEEAQWVAMRGYLRAVESRTNELGFDEQVLHLATQSGDFEALVPTREDLAPMLGAVLRVRGVCTARADSAGKLTGVQLRVNDASFLQVEEPAPADIFGIAARSLESLGRFGTTQAFNRRVKVEGVVVYAAAGRIIIHEGGVSITALTREAGLPRPGDRVEAVGFLGRQGPRVVLRETVQRRLGAAEPIEPPTLEDVSSTDPARDGHLVRVFGTVLDSAYVGPVLVMTVQRGTAVFSAILEGTGFDVRKGSEVQLTGVYDVRHDEYGQARSFALLLRDRGDVAVIRPPSPFTIGRVLAFTGVLALGTAVVVGWGVALRRRVRQQTGQIRDQLEREAHLQRELERAQRLESLGLLAGGIAHDFNNLLTVVMGNISLARSDAALEAGTQDSLGDAERAILRARDLTQQLLTFSKGGAPIRTAVDLAGVVREVTQFVLRGSPVRPEFHFADNLWPADVDKGQIGQVVQNIVINGAQSMPDGGRIAIELGNADVSAGNPHGLAPGRYLQLVIRDHGGGIRAEDLPRIFDPYFTTKRRGSGLGLATVYSIVRRHGGDIVVDSEVGRGTSFHIWLPAANGGVAAGVEKPGPSPMREPPSLSTNPPETPAPSRAAPVRVLIMDDEEPIRRLSRSILKRAGYDVTVVGDGADAVREYAAARAAGRDFTLVILDLTVPGGMGGRQALEEIRRLDPAAKAIVSSGYSNDPSLADHRELGFSAMVAKPYEVATLLDTVHAVAGRGAAPGA